ncbi:Rieske (2Fe-2S) protein [Acidisphaera sp. S103]|uniref:Rieske (2Fe-2S) protein n=1 Tax=Acidisphaera sp. S103 TaxID=1747223 RepID=UPI0020B16D2D|nr:Rieske (2Fe-2S) protein [Acidisphaera sp. S103]
MENLMPTGMRTLCRVTDIPENGAKGFPGADGAFTGLVAVRQGDNVYVYENACPHIGTPLDWTPDRFLSVDGRHLICATHGAEFTIATGACISGPCRGDRLTPVDVVIRDGSIHVLGDG